MNLFARLFPVGGPSLAVVLGLVVIGQTVSWLNRVPAVMNYFGTIMVVVVVRELGPLIAALLVLARIGTAHVVELGTARAMGEIEALEALGVGELGEDVALLVHGGVQPVLAVLHPRLQPAAPVGVQQRHELHAHVVRVGPAQALHQVAQPDRAVREHVRGVHVLLQLQLGEVVAVHHPDVRHVVQRRARAPQ